MAGSYNHLIDDSGAFTMDYIENLRDAHEALEECFWMIQWLVDRLGPVWPARSSQEWISDARTNAIRKIRESSV